jgi:hypothetical protein
VRGASVFFQYPVTRSRERDRLGTSLPDDAAALDHAVRIIRDLRQEGGHEDPGLMMIVRNDIPKTVLSLPFLAGYA